MDMEKPGHPKSELQGNPHFACHDDPLLGFGCCCVFWGEQVLLFGLFCLFCIKGKKAIHMLEGKHFHKYNKYLFQSKSKVQCRDSNFKKNNLKNNLLNINKSTSGQHSKINMNTLVYIQFLAANVLNLLANVTASQKT